MNDRFSPGSPGFPGSSSAQDAPVNQETAQESLPTTDVAQPPRQLSEEQSAEANRRMAALQAYQALIAQEPGLSIERAARRLGFDPVWLWRRIKTWEKNPSYEALIPAYHKTGRKSAVQKLSEKLGTQVVDEAITAVRGLNLDLESTTASLRLYAQSDRCPAELAQVILDPTRSSKHAIPPSLRRAAAIPEPVRDAHRGPRRLSLKGMWTPRALDILPGDIFTADDTTPIWGWWVPWREDKEHPFGVKLLQGQFLPVIDVASQCCITFVLIAREKSSYRASDIWHLFGHTFETIGLPRLGWQLERGSWESNLIAGVELDYAEGDVSLSRRVGGLRQLPTQLTPWHIEKLGEAASCFPKTLQTWTSYLPKSKSVEAFFNRSQSFEGTLWGALGRDQMRKPFEKTKKLFEACRRGAADPRQHFLSQNEMVAQLMQRIDYLNHEPMEGEVFKGVPRFKFDAGVNDHPLHLLPEDQRWLYRRDWRAVTITSGWARIRLTDEIAGERYSLFYTNPRIFADLEGQEVVAYYDRQNFEQPAQIILARTGEFICEAQYEERKGSFLDGDRTGHEIRAAWKNAVISTYATLVKHAPSRQIPAEIQQRRDAAANLPPATCTVEPRTTTDIPPPHGAGRTPARGALPPPPTTDEFARKRARLAEEAEAARALQAQQHD